MTVISSKQKAESGKLTIAREHQVNLDDIAADLSWHGSRRDEGRR